MNPLGLIVIGLGLIAIVTGVKGSQHELLTAVKGVNTAAKTAKGGG